MYSEIFRKNKRISYLGYSDEALKKWEMEVSEYRDDENTIYLNGTPNDYTILKDKGLHLLAEHMQIRVIADIDFECLKRNIKLSEVKLPLMLSKHILTSKGIPSHSYEIELTSIDELSVEQIEYLKENGGDIRSIKLNGINNAIFNVSSFLGLKKTINLITNDVNKNDKDIKKFLRVYEIIGKNLTYKKTSNFKDAINNRQASCQGFSELLKLTLNNVGVECDVIIGTYENMEEQNYEGHAWNQVKIGEQWYNCDLTWDSLKLKEGKAVKYCLRDDKFFEKDNEHIISPENSSVHKVENEYDQQIVTQYFRKDREQER